MELTVANFMKETGVSKSRLKVAQSRLEKVVDDVLNSRESGTDYYWNSSQIGYGLDVYKDLYAFSKKMAKDTIISQKLWDYLKEKYETFLNSSTITEVAKNNLISPKKLKNFLKIRKDESNRLLSLRWVENNPFSREGLVSKQNEPRVIDAYLLMEARQSRISSAVVPRSDRDFDPQNDKKSFYNKNNSNTRIYMLEEVMNDTATRARVIGFIHEKADLPIVVYLSNKHLHVWNSVRLSPKSRAPMSLNIQSRNDIHSPVILTFSMEDVSDKGQMQYFLNIILKSVNEFGTPICYRRSGIDDDPIFTVITDGLIIDMNYLLPLSTDTAAVAADKKRVFGTPTKEWIKSELRKCSNFMPIRILEKENKILVRAYSYKTKVAVLPRNADSKGNLKDLKEISDLLGLPESIVMGMMTFDQIRFIKHSYSDDNFINVRSDIFNHVSSETTFYRLIEALKSAELSEDQIIRILSETFRYSEKEIRNLLS